MKRMMFMAVLLVSACMAQAKPVDTTKALAVAQRYVGDAVNATPSSWDGLYVFNSKSGNGFVLVSADDCARPVLAYSHTGTFSPDSMPDHVKAWIGGYSSEIASLRAMGVPPTAEIDDMWSGMAKDGGTEAVEPLMTTTWNQSPYYNAQCPHAEGSSNRAVAGCVATATAQVMKYWNHPATGHGSYSYASSNYGMLTCSFDTAYSWNLMPNALNRWSSDEAVSAVAQLIYHVGVSVAMRYSTSSSGAYLSSNGGFTAVSAENSLKTYFKYSPMLHSVSKSNYTDTQWDSILKVEIDHARPVLYSGHDASGGHAFVIDGYSVAVNPRTGNRFFHVNWGWGGSYDGYFTLDSLSPGGGGTGGNATYTFNSDNQALVYVMPSANSLGDSLALVSAVTLDASMGSVSGSGRYATFADTVTIVATANPGYRFSHWKSGATDNPIQFLANGDFVDTAIFVPIHGDTLGYSSDNILSEWSDDFGRTTEWGIRIPSEVRHSNRALEAVQLYIFAGGDYDFRIYQGQSPSAATLVYSQSAFIPSWQSWRTIELDNEVYVGDHEPLWITVAYVGSGYPAAFTSYSGNDDGCWYRWQGRWEPLSNHGSYCTWMLRGVFSERSEQSFSVSVATEGSDSVYAELPAECYATGEGTYHEDSLVTITANYADDPIFWYWVTSTGDTIRQNPYSFYPTMDVTYTAVYGRDRSAVGSVDALAPVVTVMGRTIVVDTPNGERVQIFDAMGRLVSTSSSCRVAAPGIYVVRIEGGGVRKVAVM